jgi:hypothetical protein
MLSNFPPSFLQVLCNVRSKREIFAKTYARNARFLRKRTLETLDFYETYASHAAVFTKTYARDASFFRKTYASRRRRFYENVRFARRRFPARPRST